VKTYNPNLNVVVYVFWFGFSHTSTADDSALRYSPLLTIIDVPVPPTMYDSSGFKYVFSKWLKIGSTT